MRVLCAVLAVGLLCLPAQAQEKKNAEKILGTWVVSKSKQIAPGKRRANPAAAAHPPGSGRAAA